MLWKFLQVTWFMALVVFTGCQNSPSPKNAAKEVTLGEARPVDVWLLPLDDFAYPASHQLAVALSKELGLHVKSSLHVGSAGLEPFPGTSQYVVEDLGAVILKTIPNLSESHTNTVYILLTSKDMNARDRTLRFNMAGAFSEARMAVISSARLGAGLENTPEGRQVFSNRLFKLTKRQIGFSFYGYQRSSDIKDILYSPLMSADILDRIGSNYPAPK